MVTINRWLLPEGVEEILPRQAWQIQQYQRRVLDLYRSWGYELVIPPLIEFSESLLIGLGSDIDLQSYKLTDQLSGRSLAIRADITPQTAKIDAHSWQQEGPTRLCYAGKVVHTKPKSQLASREPIELGAELYGDASVYSDIEVIGLMLASLREAGISSIHLDLGHVGIYRALVKEARLDAELELLLFDALDRKARPEIDRLLAGIENADQAIVDMLGHLVDLHGGPDVIARAKTILAAAPKAVTEAIEYLELILSEVQQRHDVSISVDLAESRGYQYHTGLLFSAYVDGIGQAVANGGRYDNVGKSFGRARPATGFSINVNQLAASIQATEKETGLILAPYDATDTSLDAAIAALREKGNRVVQVFPGGETPANCSYKLVQQNDTWQVVALDND